MALPTVVTKLLHRPPRVAVVRLSGAIGAAGRFGGGLSDAALAPLLERAFRRGRPSAVALAINSPGGSPVQSALIAARIRRLAAETDTKVFAFCEDVAASGGYWLAAAADEIYADPTSVVGSIGVISAGFGLHELIARYGVERRVHTAGDSKSLLDPFRPERSEDLDRLRRILDGIHAEFIAHVRERRGAKLSDGDLFTGEVWLGRAAVETGLIDGLGHLVPRMKEMYGDKTRFTVVTPRRSLFQRLGAPGAIAPVALPALLGSTDGDQSALARSAVSGTLDALEDRALWARYGS
ncbi:MAG: S49 family peptidase [Pseudomonadota bacterium]